MANGSVPELPKAAPSLTDRRASIAQSIATGTAIAVRLQPREEAAKALVLASEGFRRGLSDRQIQTKVEARCLRFGGARHQPREGRL